MPRTYALGCFARYQTLYAQQVRAINLIDALCRTGLLKSGEHVLVAGGGIAGMTASVAARMRGAKVTMVEESEQLIPFQRASAGRFLHPYAYDWPFVEPLENTPLPFMTWTAKNSEEVFRDLERSFEAERGTLGGIEVLLGRRLRAIVDSAVRTAPQIEVLDVRQAVAHRDEADRVSRIDGDKIVLAIGFGREDRHSDIPGFWDGDGLKSVETARLSWLVSGHGDGALTDLARLLIKDFNHEKLVTRITNDEDLRREVATHILESRSIREAFEKVSKSRRNELLKDFTLRGDTNVRFCAPEKTYPESVDSCILNRFLVFLLESHITFQSGRIKEIPSLKREATYPYEIEFVPGPRGEPDPDPSKGSFHRIIPRHGVASEKDTAGESVPKVWSASPGLKEIWDRCKDRRVEWTSVPKFDDRTRVPIFRTDEVTCDQTHRVALLPTERGRCDLRILMVSSSLKPNSRPLAELVPDALKAYDRKIKVALGLQKDHDFQYVCQCVNCNPNDWSARWFEHTVRQLCRADVVLFDITDYQPLVMTLLGIRTVVRRGINITCTHDEIDSTFWSRLPFNIKELYPLGIGPDVSTPNHQVGMMLLDALAKHRAYPQYQDLPGFDALRRTARLDRFQRVIPWEQRSSGYAPSIPPIRGREMLKHFAKRFRLNSELMSSLFE